MRLRLLLWTIFLLVSLTWLGGCSGDSSASGTITPAAGINDLTNLSQSGTWAYSAGDALVLYNTQQVIVQNPYQLTGAANKASARSATSTTHATITPQETFQENLRRHAQQLWQQYGRPAPRAATRTAPALGDVSQFWVIANADETSYVQVTAQMLAEGDHCYVYVDESSTATAAQAQLLVNEWENVVYASDIAHFGQPTDIDGDPHIYLLLSPVLNGGGEDPNSPNQYAIGYFDPEDQYPTSVYPNSNMKDILYLNSAYLVTSDQPTDDNVLYGTLAHELQHDINFHYKGMNELTSFNEGRSMLAMLLVNESLPNGDPTTYGHVLNYETHPENYSVIQWTPDDYGVMFLFTTYLYDRFGAQAIVKIEQSSDTGTDNIARVTGVSFTQLYHDFLIANVLDGTTQDARYTYKSIRVAGNTGPGGGQYYGTLPGFANAADSWQQLSQQTATSASMPGYSAVYLRAVDSGKFTAGGANLLGELIHAQ